jgi:hypothetical protein
MLLVNSQKYMRDSVAAHLIHLSIIRRLDLAQRSCRDVTLSDLEQSCLDDFFQSFSNISITVVENTSVDGRWDVFDLIDGRIMRHIVRHLPDLLLPKDIAMDVHKLADLIYNLTQVDVSESIPKCHVKGGDVVDLPEEGINASLPVLPFSHPVLDEYLSPVNVSTAPSKEPNIAANIFEEISHWHNARLPVDPRHAPKPKGFFARRREQNLKKGIIAYSASLTNATGKTINPEIVPPASAAKHQRNQGRNKTSAEAGIVSQHHAKRAAQGGRQKALVEAERIGTDKTKHRTAAVREAWGERYGGFEKETSMDKRCLKVKKYLADLSNEEMSIVGGEATLYLCNAIVLMLQEAAKTGTRMPGKP